MAKDGTPPNVITGFTPLDIKPVQEPGFNPIFPKIREVPYTHDHQVILTNLDASQVNVNPFHGGDILSATDATFDAICCPSEDSLANNQPCQDCLGVVKITNSDNHDVLLVIQADGVGSAYNSEIAAGVSVRSICENGTTDLDQNLTMAASRLKGFDTNRPTTGPDLVQKALTNTRNDFGTHTTVNQLQIDLVDGRYSDRGLGDGELVVIRANGSTERFSQGTAASRLTSRSGIEGASTLHDGVLLTGDTLLMFSDGLDKLSNQDLSMIAGLSGDNLKVAIEQLIPNLRDDDRSLFIYRRK